MIETVYRLRRIAMSCALAVAVVAPVAAQKPIIRHTTNIPSNMDMMMPMALPLYLEDAQFSSTLVLVNAAGSTAPIEVVLRNEDGQTLLKQTVQLPALSQKRIPVASLLQQAGTSTAKGSILLVSPSTKSAAITGALSITQSTPMGPHYIDEEPAMPMKEGSSMLRAVTDAVTRSPVISVASLSSSQQTITYSCISLAGLRHSGTVALPTGSTRAISVCRDNEKEDVGESSFRDEDKDGNRGAFGITLSSDRGSGSFAAFGVSAHYKEGTRYLTSVPFTDPMMLESPNTVFAGVPIGNVTSLTSGTYTPALTVANFSVKPAHVTVMYYDTPGQPVKLADTVVGAGRSSAIALAEVAGNRDLEDSIVVSSDRGPGEVISKLTSVGTGALRRIEILGKDEGDMLNSGQHPWSLEEGNESTLLLFNHSKEKASFEVEIDKDGISWNKKFGISPMRTLALDIRSLLDKEVPDDKGVKLSRQVGKEYGEVSWNTAGPGIAAGRLLQTNRFGAMARSFSCGAYTYVCGITTSFPGAIGVGFYGNGSVLGIDACQSVARCSNGEVTHRSPSIHYSWSTDNTSIASIPGSTTVQQASLYGVSVGTTTARSRACDGYGCCVEQPAPQPVKPTVAIQNPSTSGYTLYTGNQMGLSASGNPSGGTYAWTSSQASIASASPMDQANTTITGLSPGTAVIKVGYAVNGQSADQDGVVVNVIAPPIVVNFQKVNSSAEGGVLVTNYTWQSSSGNLSDLSQCTVRESVATMPFPSPPYQPNNPPNPTVGSVAGSRGGFSDNQDNPGFLRPYSASDFTNSQNFQFSCPYYMGGDFIDLQTGIAIERRVSQNPDGTWMYVVTKSGDSATVNPLP